MNLKDLHSPFPAAEVEWRIGSTNSEKTSGLALAYLTARHVMERLDAVCGPENWQDRYEFHGARTVCYLSLRIGDEWVTKADGAGDSDVEAEKGAISDALKRAAVKWGIGRYLYDLGNVWVDVEPAGRSVRIKKNQYAKLQAELNNRFGPSLKAVEPVSQPEPAADDGLALYTRLSQANKKCATKAEFSALWGNPKTITAQNSLNEDYQAKLEKEKTNKFAALEEKEPSNYKAPDFEGMEP